MTEGSADYWRGRQEAADAIDKLAAELYEAATRDSFVTGGVQRGKHLDGSIAADDAYRAARGWD